MIGQHFTPWRAGETGRAFDYLTVLETIGRHVTLGSRILDFGCGSGNMVHAFTRLGFDAFGCDFRFGDGTHTDELLSDGRLRRIEPHPYRLPFDHDSFDVIVSDQVFEHVIDYDVALREIARVLRVDGDSLHVFPSRYTPVEVHVRVPGATLLRNEQWLRLWAHLGIRNGYQTGDTYAIAAEKNREYLRSCTNYCSRRKIEVAFARYFMTVRFSERAYLCRSGPGGSLRRRAGAIPGAALVYSAFRSRVVYASGARGKAA